MRFIMDRNFQFDTFGLADVWYLSDTWKWACYYLDGATWYMMSREVRP